MRLTSAAPGCLGTKIQILWELLDNSFDAAGSPHSEVCPCRADLGGGGGWENCSAHSIHPPEDWKEHVPCCVSSLADSQDLTPNIQECPALGKVFFAVRRTDWEECWTSQWTPISLKKRLFICRQDFCFDLTIRDDFQSVFLNVDNISRGVLQEWWALLCEERLPFICILPLNLQKNPYIWHLKKAHLPRDWLAGGTGVKAHQHSLLKWENSSVFGLTKRNAFTLYPRERKM